MLLKRCMQTQLCTEISNQKMSWFAKMDTWNLSIWELAKNSTVKLQERHSQSLVLQTTWHQKFSQVRDTTTLLIYGLSVLSFMSSWQVMFLLVKMQKIHMKFIRKSLKILLLSPNIWETLSQILWFLNCWARTLTQDWVDRILTWKSIHFSMDLTGIN